MQLDVSFLPAFGAAFILMFARLGTMIMLLPGLGERSVPVRVRLTVALVLTFVMFPLHRAGYTIDLRAPGPVIVALGQELLVGLVLGMTARLTISALQTAGSVIAQQLGLGFVTAVDPTQGQQGIILGNFLTLLGVTLIFATDLHHLALAAIVDSYKMITPTDPLMVSDALQMAAPFIVFGLVFNVGLGILARLMPALQVYFLSMPGNIMVGLLLFAFLLTMMMGWYLTHVQASLAFLGGG